MAGSTPMTEHAEHSWSDPAHVEEYLARMDRLGPRAQGEAALAELLPADPRLVLDLGCGDGRVSALVLAARPSIEQVVAVDISPPMLARARERFAGDRRVEVREGDLEAPVVGLGPRDLVVSGFAIHHVPDRRKQALFAEVLDLLEPGGTFANLEVVASPTPALHATFLEAIGRAHDDPGDVLAPVDRQLEWLRDVGFGEVDCLWKWRGFALLVGQKPAA
jgi:tRNA (cmo5U34)-methyltransferase